MPATLEPEPFLNDFVKAAHAGGFAVEQYGEVDGFPLLAAELAPKHPRMSAYLSAGIHGDEPAGPLALLTLARQGWFDPEIAWHVLPLLNPTGMAVGTRESRASGLDLNRDYRAARAPETRAHLQWLRHHAPRYDLALLLHEDWEAQGFYLYEMTTPGTPEPGRAILQSVEPATGIDYSPEIDGLPSRNGLLRPHADAATLAAIAHWPEQLYLQHHHTPLSLTFETPSAQPLPTRVMAHIIAIKTALNPILAPRLNDFFEI